VNAKYNYVFTYLFFTFTYMHLYSYLKQLTEEQRAITNSKYKLYKYTTCIQWGEQVFDTLPILQVFPLFIIGTLQL